MGGIARPYSSLPIQPLANLAAARDVNTRKFDQWCEIVVPTQDDAGHGFGGSSITPTLFGKVRCSLGRRRNVTDGVEDVGEWEVSFPANVIVPDNAQLFLPGDIQKWVPETIYNIGDLVIPYAPQADVRCYFMAMSFGASDVSEPAWLNQGIVVDNTVKWRNCGSYTNLQVVGDDRANSNFEENVVRCKEIT